MKHIIIMLIAIISFVTTGCSAESKSVDAQIKELAQADTPPAEIVKALPVPEDTAEYFQVLSLLTKHGCYDAYDVYNETHWESLKEARALEREQEQREVKDEMLDTVVQFIEKGGVSMVTRIKVDPAAYAGLMTAAAAPEGTDLETGVQFDPEGDQVLINYGQPGRAPAVTVTYPITGMIEQMGQIMSQFDPEIGEEVPEAVAEWQATRQDIVERLAQQ